MNRGIAHSSFLHVAAIIRRRQFDLSLDVFFRQPPQQFSQPLHRVSWN